jgi:ABC-type multidrug transport system fused ATPase/permease subunit
LTLFFSLLYVFFAGSTSEAGNHELLTVYKVLPVIPMMIVCIYFGFVWHKSFYWEHTLKSEVAKQDRVTRAVWAVNARQTALSYGQSYLTTQFDTEFGITLETQIAEGYVLWYHDMDARWLSDSFGDFVILSVFVSLAFLHIESYVFGAGYFTLGNFLSTMGIYRLVKKACITFCNSCREIEHGVAMINSCREFLDKKNTISDAAFQSKKRVELFCGEMPEALAVVFQDVKSSDGDHTFQFTGSVPLGKLYLIPTKGSKREVEALMRLWIGTMQPSEGFVMVPPFVRTVGLIGDRLPELFHLSAIDNVLLFADKKRFGKAEAMQILSLLDVFDDLDSASDTKCPEKFHSSIEEVLDPASVSNEDRMLILIAQAILADPEVLILIRPLLNLRDKFHLKVLRALMTWQRDGALAVVKSNKQQMSNGGQKKAGASKFPAWLDGRTGKVQRTLIVNHHAHSQFDELKDVYEEEQELFIDSGKVSTSCPADPAKLAQPVKLELEP